MQTAHPWSLWWLANLKKFVEPGQPKMNPTYPTNLYKSIRMTSCCKGKMEENKFLRTHWWMRSFQRPMLNKLPRKASGSLLSLLAGPSVASNASTVIPDTACSWTFLPAIMSSLDHPGKATKQVVSLGKEGVKQKVEQSGFWYPTRIKHAQKVQLRVTWLFEPFPTKFQLFLMLMRCFCL